jgi:O-antigen/teichoic acid export membrane protein
MWAYIITSLHRILLPSLSKSFHESSDHFRLFVGTFFRFSALVAIPIGLLGTLCATPLMKVLYSARYEASGIIFGILVWGFVLATIRSILEIALIASDRQRRYMRGIIFLSLVYTVLTPILTLRFGITGAAVAVVSCESIYFAYLMFTSPCSEPTSLFRGFWKPLTAAIVAMVPLLLIGELHPLLRIPFGMAVFGAVVIILKGLTSDDVEVIKSVIRRNIGKASA